MIRIQPENFHLNIPDQSGVYWIYSLDDSDAPIPLSRVLGIDRRGILYIGKSENLKERLRMLWRVLNPDYRTTGHTFGVNYKSLQAIQAQFPLHTLAFEFELNQDYGMRETQLIEDYRQEFGEVPPLNGRK